MSLACYSPDCTCSFHPSCPLSNPYPYSTRYPPHPPTPTAQPCLPQRPALDANPPSVFARIEVLAADEISLITQLADHVGARDMSIQTLRTHHKLDGDGDDVYTAIATIATAKPKEEIDVAAVENDFYEMAEKLDVSIKFEHLA